MVKAAGKTVAGIALMLVDDHPIWRDSLRRVLEHRRIGRVVAEADDGEQAVDLASSTRPDVVVMDMYLPTLGGVEATRRILAEQPDVKILVLSASDRTSDVLEAVRAGVLGYLLKTARPSDVADAVLRVHRGELVLPGSVAQIVLEELRRSNGARSADASRDASANLFRREGEYWTLRFEGSTIRLRDSRGLGYLHELLRKRGREIHVSDLVSAHSADAPRRGVAETDGLAPVAADAGMVLDVRARAEYTNRLRELDDDLAEAQEWGDSERAARIRSEMDAVSAQLSAAYGLGGRPRMLGSVTERMRKSVGNRIRDAIGRIEAEHPTLGRHLLANVTTGTFCSYSPGDPISWSL